MSRQKGIEAENLACDFLLQNGFEILDRNFFARVGEIDIIAQKGEVVHFIEVKSGESFEPIYNITPCKLKKLIMTINHYIAIKNLTQSYCLDALIVKGSHCDLLENITLN